MGNWNQGPTGWIDTGGSIEPGDIHTTRYDIIIYSRNFSCRRGRKGGRKVLETGTGTEYMCIVFG